MDAAARRNLLVRYVPSANTCIQTRNSPPPRRQVAEQFQRRKTVRRHPVAHTILDPARAIHHRADPSVSTGHTPSIPPHSFASYHLPQGTLLSLGNNNQHEKRTRSVSKHKGHRNARAHKSALSHFTMQRVDKEHRKARRDGKRRTLSGTLLARHGKVPSLLTQDGKKRALQF